MRMRKRNKGGEWMKRQWSVLWMAALCLLLAARSEERRVGKECRL